MAIPTFVRQLFEIPAVKRVLTRFNHPLVHRLYPLASLDRLHPFDKAHGVDTGGFVPVDKISTDSYLAPLIHPYGPSQPSVTRRALQALGDVQDYTLADLGCGKGRVTFVATEFPFRAILGIELSPELVTTARANAQIIAQRFPRRTKVDIFEANAVTFPYPEGKLVIFLYHSFGRELLAELITHLEARLAATPTPLFFVYYNPVNGDLLDASPVFERWSAESMPCDPTEIGFGPDTSDSVIIWQAGTPRRQTPHAHCERKIVIIKPKWRVEVEPAV